MQPMTYEDFVVGRERDPAYYVMSRWEYYSRVIELSDQLAKNPERILELGPHLLPIFPDSDTMDFKGDKNPTYVHDGGDVPWPIPSRTYDLFIGLQVFEHLGKVDETERVAGWRHQAQADAFQEVKRVAKHAIISLPWKWENKRDLRHAGIDEDVVSKWFDAAPNHQEIVGRRAIFAWTF